MKKKDYLKPQIVVVETKTCLLSTNSVTVSNKQMNDSGDLKNEGLTLDSEGILWGE